MALFHCKSDLLLGRKRKEYTSVKRKPDLLFSVNVSLIQQADINQLVVSPLDQRVPASSVGGPIPDTPDPTEWPNLSVDDGVRGCAQH